MATRPLPFPAPALTDPDSLPALRRGDPDALGALYHHHAPALLLLARRLLGSAAEAEDLVQDLFVGLPEALAHYQERGSLGPWLRTVATRMALMRLRSRRTRGEVALGTTPLSAAPATEPADRMTLTTLLAQLPEEQRVVVVLRSIEGYSHAEVAELLGLRRNTVEVRYHRALERLRDLLEAP